MTKIMTFWLDVCRYGTEVLSLKAYIQPIVELLGDPSAPVRDAAINTLVEIYKHVGKCIYACIIQPAQAFRLSCFNSLLMACVLQFSVIFLIALEQVIGCGWIFAERMCHRQRWQS